MAYDNFEAFLDAPAKGGKQYEAPLVDLTEMPGLYDNANDPKRIPMTAGDVVWDTVGSIAKAGLQTIGAVPQIANFLTGDFVDVGVNKAISDMSKKVTEATQSPEAKRLRQEQADLIERDDIGMLGVLAHSVQNPYLAGQSAIESAGSFLVPMGAAVGAGKLARWGGLAANEINTATRTGAAVANGLMNAGSTAADMEGTQSERMMAGGISGAGTGVINLPGSLESYAARSILNRADDAVMPVARSLSRSLGKIGLDTARAVVGEGAQEFGEGMSEKAGQALAKGEALNAANIEKWAKQSVPEAVSGALFGGAVGNVNATLDVAAENHQARRHENERRAFEAWLTGENAPPVDAVFDNIKGQLDSLKRFLPEENDAYASLVSRFFATQAKTMGVTPEALYQRYPLKIVAEGTGGNQGYGQPVTQGFSWELGQQRRGLFDLPDIAAPSITGTEFGADEKAIRAGAMQKLNAIRKRGTPLKNNDTGWNLTVSLNDWSKIAKNPEQTVESLQAVFSIEQLAECAVLAESHEDTEHNNPDVQGIHRLYAPIGINGTLYRAKLTVRDYTGVKSGDRTNLHALETIEIEKPGGAIHPATRNPTAKQGTPTELSASISDLLSGSTRDDGTAWDTRPYFLQSAPSDTALRGTFNPDTLRSGRSRGNSPVVTLNGDELGIRDGETIQDAAWRYYDGLMKNPVTREGFGEVRFYRKSGWQKLENSSLSDQEKLKLIPAIPDIIKSGDYVGNYKIPEGVKRKDGITTFHYFEGNVNTPMGMKYAGVTVGEDSRGNKFYNLNEDPDVLFEKKKARESARNSAKGLVPSEKASRLPELAVRRQKPLQDTEADILEQSINAPDDGVNITILNQTPSAAAPRGTFNPETMTIALLKGADFSTFLHEAGHFFLEAQLDMASQIRQEAEQSGAEEITPEKRQLVSDVNTLFDWFGIRDSQEWTSLSFEEKSAYHEQFARGFEQYLSEGKSPNLEMRNLFQRFRDWLIEVYQDVSRLNVELSDEVRAGFDRMLAGETVKSTLDVTAENQQRRHENERRAFEAWLTGENAAPVDEDRIRRNIGRGRNAMRSALRDKTSAHRAMFREGMGWVDFVWGNEGRVTPSGKTRGGMGISHIIAERMRKDKMAREDAINFLMDTIPDVIARGEEVRRNEVDKSTRVVIGLNGNEVVLVKNRGNNSWVTSGWMPRSDAVKAANDTNTTTHKTADSSDGNVGAEREQHRNPAASMSSGGMSDFIADPADPPQGGSDTTAPTVPQSTDTRNDSGQTTVEPADAVFDNIKGQFDSSGREGERKEKEPEDISGLLTPEYMGVKGSDAINKLRKEKQGYVKAAFTREDIGDIDLFWGDDGIGLMHIIDRRTEQGVDIDKLLSEIPEVIEKGKLRINEEGNFEIWHNGNMAVVYPEFKGNKITFLFTAYRRRKAPK